MQFKGYWRTKSPERFLAEVDNLKERYKIDVIKIWDDNFLAMKSEKISEVTSGLNKMKLKFLCHSRPEHMSEGKIKTLAQNGCIQIGVGVESGNPEYRKQMLNRQMSNETIVSAFKNCRKHNITASAYCMIGMPDESREDILMTARLLREAQPHVIVHAIFTPYEGNSLYNYAKEKDYIDENIDHEDYMRCFMHMPSISAKEIESLYRTFYYYCRLDDSYYPLIQKGESDPKILESLVSLLENNDS